MNSRSKKKKSKSNLNNGYVYLEDFRIQKNVSKKNSIDW